MHPTPRGFAKTAFAALLAALMGLAIAQDAAGTPSVTVQDHPEFGQVLTDEEGRTLYLFQNENMEATDPDRMTEGVRSNAAACEGPCLENWPPVEGADVQPGEGVDAELLYVADVGGRQQAVYNGWPLYYFANDTAPGQANGQGLGGGGNTWYVVNAEGQAITTPPSEGDVHDDATQDGAAAEPMDDATEDGATGDEPMGDEPMDDGAMDGAGDGATNGGQDGAAGDATEEDAQTD